MKRTIVIITLALAVIAGAAMNRYPVGRPVPVEVYTMPFTDGLFDPNSPDFAREYKFLQRPTKDWTDQFGDNERTLLIHAISELRVVVAGQGRKLLDLEARLNALSDPNIPVSISAKIINSNVTADPNEAKE